MRFHKIIVLLDVQRGWNNSHLQSVFNLLITRTVIFCISMSQITMAITLAISSSHERPWPNKPAYIYASVIRQLR